MPPVFFMGLCGMKSPPQMGLLLVGVGTHMAAMVIVGFALGYALDVWLGSEPWLMLALGCMGFVGGILKAHKMLSRWN